MSRRRELHFGDRVVWCFRERMASVYSALQDTARARPDACALVFGEQAWSYAQVEAQARRVAAGLHRLGVAPGDRVAMQVRNRPEFVFVFFGIQRLGAVAVPIDVRLLGSEVAHVVANAGASVFVHERETADRMDAVRQRGLPVAAVELPDSGALFAQVPVDDAPAVHAPASEDDVALILYTSGTTGQPKGAAIAHVNVAHSVRHHAGTLGLSAVDRSLIAVPLSHVTGVLCGVLAPFSTGGTMILLPTFKATEFLRAAAQVRMTYTIMVPAMYELCLRSEAFERVDLSAWRLGHFGGAPMPRSTIDALARRLPQLRLVNGYGATEVCSPAAMWPLGQESVPPDSVGRAVPCAEIVVVDPATGIEVPPGEPGELWIGGPMVIKDYWNDPAATARGIVGGFWRSGDIGRVDADGNVFVHDRLKDMINRGGYKIYSAEVEGLLLQLPGVVEAAVVARADPVLGERVHAFVTVTRAVDESELVALCTAQLSDYKCPESWTIAHEPLPRTLTGKLDKKRLRAGLVAA